MVVAYEADNLDPVEHLGWSVVVTGTAHLVRDPGEMAHYQHALTPWVDKEMDQVIRIRPETVTGFRLDGRGHHPGVVDQQIQAREGPSGARGPGGSRR